MTSTKSRCCSGPSISNVGCYHGGAEEDLAVRGVLDGPRRPHRTSIPSNAFFCLLVGRDERRAKETLSAIQSGRGTAEIVLGDVSTVAGAKAVAAQVLAKAPRVDVLVDNAGGTFKTHSTTADGVEMTFALNTLGAFVPERELHRALAAAKGRIVNVATGFLNSFPVAVDDLAAPKTYAPRAQYGRSKQASVMIAVEQARRYESEGVSAVSLHPGIIMGTRFGGGQPKVAQSSTRRSSTVARNSRSTP